MNGMSAPRPAVSIRISPAGIELVDKLAADTGTNRSRAVRAILTEAFAAPDIMAAAARRLSIPKL